MHTFEIVKAMDRYEIGDEITLCTNMGMMKGVVVDYDDDTVTIKDSDDEIIKVDYSDIEEI